MSPTTRPSGCADSNNCMMRRRGSVPMADIMSAYLATSSALFLVAGFVIFPYLQKYGDVSSLFFHLSALARRAGPPTCALFFWSLDSESATERRKIMFKGTLRLFVIAALVL